MALVIIGHRAAAAALHRQPWLSAVERLNLALLIDRQHQCVLRRIDIEADDNAAHVKYLPGRKTDVNDATWLADLLAHGLIRGSFVPDRLRRPTLLAPL